jgi:hypothetical protein
MLRATHRIGAKSGGHAPGQCAVPEAHDDEVVSGAPGGRIRERAGEASNSR